MARADAFPAPQSNRTMSPGEIARTAADRCTVSASEPGEPEITATVCSLEGAADRGSDGFQSAAALKSAAAAVGRSSR